MTKRLLYLEDDLWHSEGSISIALEVSYGFEVTNCETIGEARAKLRRQEWSAILMDIGLNSGKALVYEETSLVLLEEIRNGDFSDVGNLPSLPVVFASGVWDMNIKMPDGKLPSVSELITTLDVTRHHCISKPVIVEKLNRALTSAMGKEDR